MPKIYRSMYADGDKPAVGTESSKLGVRLDGKHADINADEDGDVHPGAGGLSISPCLANLPAHLLPVRLKDAGLIEEARGKNSLSVWKHGEGPFANEAVSSDLHLRLDEQRPKHGFVEPNRSMQLADYQDALAATRDGWIVDETHRDDCPFCGKS